MTKLQQEQLDKITEMLITVITHPGSDLVELWINNVFIAQADKMYINHYLEDKAVFYQYFPETETTTEII